MYSRTLSLSRLNTWEGLLEIEGQVGRLGHVGEVGYVVKDKSGGISFIHCGDPASVLRDIR